MTLPFKSVNSAENNGIAGLCDIEPTEKGGIITFSDTTDGNTFFYQPDDFVGFAHVQGMYPKFSQASDLVLLFISMVLMFDSKGRYSYGRKMRRDTISEIMLKLPADINGNPDWQFMEDYIKSLHHKPLTTKNKSGQAPALNVQDWGEFTIEQLFPVLVKGKCGDASSLIDGTEINYIGAKYNDNGVMKSCAKSENADFISNGNCIAMIGQGQGSAGYAIYLDSDFIGATSLNLGYADWINPYTAHFVTTILCQEYDKYSFGRSWTGDRLKRTVIKLPIDADGNPDWQFMENYIKALPYGDKIV